VRTRGDLLSAATTLFAARGYDGTPVELIARAAGVNKAMINYHFGGKRGLYAAILQETLVPAIARLRPLRNASRPAAERLEEFVEIYAGTVAARPELPAMILREAISGAGRLDRRTARYLLELFSVLRGILEQGIREGAFRRVNPFSAHLALVGSLVFFFSTTATRRRMAREMKLDLPLPSPGEFVDHVRQITLLGLAAKPARRSHA